MDLRQILSSEEAFASLQGSPWLRQEIAKYSQSSMNTKIPREREKRERERERERERKRERELYLFKDEDFLTHFFFEMHFSKYTKC